MRGSKIQVAIALGDFMVGNFQGELFRNNCLDSLSPGGNKSMEVSYGAAVRGETIRG